MSDERRARGFEPLGSSGASALGLSGSRTKDLELQAAWRRVAGPKLAERVTAVSVRRGVLALEVREPAWRHALLHLLPELGARLAREYPSLGIARFKFE